MFDQFSDEIRYRFAEDVNGRSRDVVFFLGFGPEAGANFAEPEAGGWTPRLYVLGTLVRRNIADAVTVKMRDKVFLAFLDYPSRTFHRLAPESSALLQKNKLDSTHAAAQGSGIAAARILVHALELSGKDLSRERPSQRSKDSTNTTRSNAQNLLWS